MEFDEQLFQMALHGVEQSHLDKLRRQFYGGKQCEDVKIPLTEFKNMGLKLGKPNNTKIIRE